MKKPLLATLIATGMIVTGMASAGSEPPAAAKADTAQPKAEPTMVRAIRRSVAEADALPLKAESISEKAQAVESRALAAQLAAYGLQANDPVALIAAARITQTVTTQDQALEGKPEEVAMRRKEVAETGSTQGQALEQKPQEGDKKAEGPDKKAGVDLQSIEFLLGKARELSGGDQTILALARRSELTGVRRGEIYGPSGHSSTINANTIETYYNQWTFKAGESARMAVIGDSGTDLDCYLYDHNGNLIFYDDDGSDQCFLAWTPLYTGSFSLKVVNNGNVHNRYTIIWN